MTDEPTTDKPLAHIVEVEQQMPQPEEPMMSAAARLRAFEDEHFGKKAVRINGRVERGFGSPYQAMSPAKRKVYLALEKLIEVEERLAAAHSALIAADAEHEISEKAVAAAEQEADAATDD